MKRQNRSTHSPGGRPAFTLIELLVVIGIIVILVGLLLPVLAKVRGQGVRTRIRSDLNAIGSALDAYKQDFGDYPRVIYNSTSPYNVGSGAETLGKALLGLGASSSSSSAGSFNYVSSAAYFPGQVVLNSGTQFVALKPNSQSNPVSPVKNDPTATWEAVTIVPDSGGVTGGGFDGADGPGFRVRTSGFGQVYGPYLQVDKFKTRGLALVDYVGNPILYYPANPGKPSVTTSVGAGSFGTGNIYISTAPGITMPGTLTAPTATCVSLYNYSDNDTAALQAYDTSIPQNFPNTVAGKGINVMEAMLGNYTITGWIDSTNGDIPATTAPYLLWSAGPDGIFGPVQASKDLNGFTTTLTPAQREALVQKCDDVTNFSTGH